MTALESRFKAISMFLKVFLLVNRMSQVVLGGGERCGGEIVAIEQVIAAAVDSNSQVVQPVADNVVPCDSQTNKTRGETVLCNPHEARSEFQIGIGEGIQRFLECSTHEFVRRVAEESIICSWYSNDSSPQSVYEYHVHRIPTVGVDGKGKTLTMRSQRRKARDALVQRRFLWTANEIVLSTCRNDPTTSKTLSTMMRYVLKSSPSLRLLGARGLTFSFYCLDNGSNQVDWLAPRIRRYHDYIYECGIFNCVDEFYRRFQKTTDYVFTYKCVLHVVHKASEWGFKHSGVITSKEVETHVNICTSCAKRALDHYGHHFRDFVSESMIRVPEERLAGVATLGYLVEQTTHRSLHPPVIDILKKIRYHDGNFEAAEDLELDVVVDSLYILHSIPKFSWSRWLSCGRACSGLFVCHAWLSRFFAYAVDEKKESDFLFRIFQKYFTKEVLQFVAVAAVGSNVGNLLMYSLLDDDRLLMPGYLQSLIDAAAQEIRDAMQPSRDLLYEAAGKCAGGQSPGHIKKCVMASNNITLAYFDYHTISPLRKLPYTIFFDLDSAMAELATISPGNVEDQCVRNLALLVRSKWPGTREQLSKAVEVGRIAPFSINSTERSHCCLSRMSRTRKFPINRLVNCGVLDSLLGRPQPDSAIGNIVGHDSLLRKYAAKTLQRQQKQPRKGRGVGVYMGLVFAKIKNSFPGVKLTKRASQITLAYCASTYKHLPKEVQSACESEAMSEAEQKVEAIKDQDTEDFVALVTALSHDSVSGRRLLLRNTRISGTALSAFLDNTTLAHPYAKQHDPTPRGQWQEALLSLGDWCRLKKGLNFNDIVPDSGVGNGFNTLVAGNRHLFFPSQDIFFTPSGIYMYIFATMHPHRVICREVLPIRSVVRGVDLVSCDSAGTIVYRGTPVFVDCRETNAGCEDEVFVASISVEHLQPDGGFVVGEMVPLLEVTGKRRRSGVAVSANYPSSKATKERDSKEELLHDLLIENGVLFDEDLLSELSNPNAHSISAIERSAIERRGNEIMDGVLKDRETANALVDHEHAEGADYDVDDVIEAHMAITLRGGGWTKREKGVFTDNWQALVKTKTMRAFCKAYGLQISFSVDYRKSAIGLELSEKVVKEFQRRLAELYVIFMSQASFNYEFGATDFDGWKERRDTFANECRVPSDVLRRLDSATTPRKTPQWISVAGSGDPIGDSVFP